MHGLWELTSVVRRAASRMAPGVDHIHVRELLVPFRHRHVDAMLSAVEALASALTRELVPVRVNGVTPGLMDTPRLYTDDGAKGNTLVQNRAAMVPGKRVGTADEVAQVLLMLMAHAYVTGEVVHVDGAGRFVQHRSSDPVDDRWSGVIPSTESNAHGSDASAGQVELLRARHSAAEDGAPQPLSA
jgi:hypothetical protein